MRKPKTRCRPLLVAWLVPVAWLACAALAGAASDDYVVRTKPSARRHGMELLRFARDWQREMCDVIGLPAPQMHGPVEIELDLAPPGAAIDHAVLRGAQGYFGLVRIPDPEDSRGVLVRLTDKGRALEPAFEAISNGLQRLITDRLSEEEAALLDRLLDKCVNG